MTAARVLFVTTKVTTGGAERLLAELIGRLDRSRYQPGLVCLKELGELGEQLASADLPVWEAQASSGRNPILLGWLYKVISRTRPEIVCTIGTGGDRSFWGRLAARLAGVPVVISCLHSMGLPDRLEFFNRLLTGWTDGFVAVARRHRRYLVQQTGLPANKIRVIYNGVDLERFVPGPVPNRLRDQLGFLPDTPVVGQVCMLRPEKNVSLFLQAARLVHERVPRARFLIVGDGPERERLINLAGRLGIAESVRFVGLRNDVGQMLRTMDVVVLSSLSEACPVSILEAFACGKPVVAPDVGAVREVVTPGQTGYLVPPGAVHAMARSIAWVLAAPAHARQMGLRARRRVETEFGLDAMVKGYHELFDQLLARKRSSYAAMRNPLVSTLALLLSRRTRLAARSQEGSRDGDPLSGRYSRPRWYILPPRSLI